MKTTHVQLSTAEHMSDRCQALYDLAKKMPKRDDKSTDQYILEKDQKEYTFAPNLEKETSAVRSKDIIVNPDHIQAAIKRVAEGRAERERVQKALQRGSDDSGMRFGIQKSKFTGSFQQFSRSPRAPTSQSREDSKVPIAEPPSAPRTKAKAKVNEEHDTGPFSTGVSPKEEVKQGAETAARHVELPKTEDGVVASAPDGDEKEAQLFIDVNLGNKQKRIVVYKGDTAPQLADKFARENSKPSI